MTRHTAVTRVAPAILGWGALLILQSGCGLLDTATPDIIEPGKLESPEGAAARRIGAIRDFGLAKDGDGSQFGTEGLLALTGDMADEFAHSGFIPSTVEFDQRMVLVNNESLSEVYFRLHRARVAAEGAAAALERHSLDPANDPGIAEMLALAGFTYVYFGENFCSGVPYSRVNGDQLELGPSDSTVGTLRRAIERFDSAVAHPGLAADPTGELQSLAQVGRGRALLDLGQFAEASLAVQAVPTSFQYLSEHAASPLTLANAIFVYGTSEPGADGGSLSVADADGGNGLPYRALLDPRVPYDSSGHFGFDQTTPQFNVLKYPTQESPVLVADGIEARLIEAEAFLQASDFNSMTGILNQLRATAISPALPALSVPATQTAAENQLFQERALWLFATGHRLGDMRRLVRQYGRSADVVFPVGSYLRGGSYGTDVNFAVPLDEEQNPRFDRSTCDPTLP
ncbi:MAG: hypothetical protein ACREMO_13445 [Gemmatimonadales bacterium]